MKQGRTLLLAFATLVALGAVAPAITSAASKPAKPAASAAAKKNGLRQFSGWVTAVDKSSLTVEKRGKNPRTMVFVRDAQMRTTGEIEKDARVTVYYRDEDGRTTAHRVVVKQSAGRAAKAAKGSNGS